MDTPRAVEELAARLRSHGWVTDLFVGGSAATGDYRAGVSDLDLVALTDGPLDRARRTAIVGIHQELDATAAQKVDLGCVYVAAADLANAAARHPTWTHGRMIERPLSAVARADLVRHGFAVMGRSPDTVLPSVSDDDVRHAAQLELTGYWAMAVHRPWWWLDPSLSDLGLTSMARGRHALATGTLVTKSSAIDLVQAPAWLRRDVRARREGRVVRSPRLAAAWYAWNDARRTTAAARRWRVTPR